MSQNVAGYRRAVDALVAEADPKVVLITQISGVEGPILGHAGVRTWWEDMTGAFQSCRWNWRMSGVAGIGSSGAGPFTHEGARATCDSMHHLRTPRGGETGNAFASRAIGAFKKHSKPPGCRSRAQVSCPDGSKAQIHRAPLLLPGRLGAKVVGMRKAEARAEPTDSSSALTVGAMRFLVHRKEQDEMVSLGEFTGPLPEDAVKTADEPLRGLAPPIRNYTVRPVGDPKAEPQSYKATDDEVEAIDAFPI